jgi:hypothetical protein
MASSGKKDLFKEAAQEAVISEQSDRIDGESDTGGIKMSDYQTAVKQGIDDEDEAESSHMDENHNLIEIDENSSDVMQFKSEGDYNSARLVAYDRPIYEVMKMMISSAVALLIASVFIVIFHDQLSKTITDLKNAKPDEILIIAFLLVLIEIL